MVPSTKASPKPATSIAIREEWWGIGLKYTDDFLPRLRPAPRRTAAAVRCRHGPARRLARGRGRPQRHRQVLAVRGADGRAGTGPGRARATGQGADRVGGADRKSTRLNSSHVKISYA